MFTRAAVFTAVVASAAAFQPVLRAGVAPKVRTYTCRKKFRCHGVRGVLASLKEIYELRNGLRIEEGCRRQNGAWVAAARPWRNGRATFKQYRTDAAILSLWLGTARLQRSHKFVTGGICGLPEASKLVPLRIQFRHRIVQIGGGCSCGCCCCYRR